MGGKRRRWNPKWALDQLELGADRRHELQVEGERFARANERRVARALRRRGEDVAGVLKSSKSAGKPGAESEVSTSPALPPPEGRHVLVWQATQLDELEAAGQNRTSDRDELSRLKKVVAQMRKVGPWRRAVPLPADWRALVDDLAKHFPNFSQVTDYIAAGCALSERKDGIVRFGHLLLSGPPGIGKTLFVDALARSFALPQHRLDMASAQSGSRLAGSEEFWSNSKSGLLFDLLALGTGGAAANSLILLDELEKAGGDPRYDATGSLYSLLEPASARNFADLSHPSITLDASHLIFIGTANEPHRIAEPIRSRLRHFPIAAPSPAQARGIVERIYADGAAELGMAAQPLDGAILDRLTRYPPRIVRQMVQEGFGRALAAGRSTLEARDFPSDPVRAPSPPPARKTQALLLVATSPRGNDDDEGGEDGGHTLH